MLSIISIKYYIAYNNNNDNITNRINALKGNNSNNNNFSCSHIDNKV